MTSPSRDDPHADPSGREPEAVGLFGERSGLPASMVNRANAGCLIGCLVGVVGLVSVVVAALIDPALGLVALVALLVAAIAVWRRI